MLKLNPKINGGWWKGEETMRVYEVRHRCGCKLMKINESYQGGALPYCKKCHIDVAVTKLNVKNKELKFEVVPELEPEPQSQSQSQSQLVRTGWCTSQLAFFVQLNTKGGQT